MSIIVAGLVSNPYSPLMSNTNYSETVTRANNIATEVRAAIVQAATKLGESESVRALKVFAHVSVIGGRVLITFTDAPNRTLLRAKAFAAKWIAKHYPEVGTLCHEKRYGGKLWATYFSGGQRDGTACGLFYRVEFNEAEKHSAILGHIGTY